jgi:hypothetical protein
MNYITIEPRIIGIYHSLGWITDVYERIQKSKMPHVALADACRESGVNIDKLREALDHLAEHLAVIEESLEWWWE